MSEADPRSRKGADQESEEPHGPTVRDRRRIDPETYQVREPQPVAAPEPGGGETDTGTTATTEGNEVTELKAALAERTGDLQRLQA